jgi:hypothetical protein
MISVQHMVHSVTEKCPLPPPELETEYVLNEEPVPHQCCNKIVPVACRVGDNIYKVTSTSQVSYYYTRVKERINMGGGN